MDTRFWHYRWQNNELGFQLEQPHPLLRHCLPMLLRDQQQVLVPLCGKSPDLVYLAKHLAVVGAELSDIACNAFFAEQQLGYQRQQQADFVCYRSERIKIWQGDFFQLNTAQVAGCTLVYDRAALIALPTPMRQCYVAKLKALLPSGTELLLISVEYPLHEKAGPPFSVDYAEVHRLFAGDSIELLAELDQTGKGFARRRFATGYLLERAYHITLD
ncbi:thiopurine S-methyltransferase [Rheinheimera gaetbuli]